MGLHVIHNGENIDPEKFILLYMPLERADAVREYLDKHDLTRKFELIEGKITTELMHDTDDTPISDPITSLVLKMRSDKILFEYKLSGRHHELLTKITEYVNGREEES